MKKLAFIIGLTMATTYVSAQIQKGRILIAGDLNYSGQKMDQEDTTGKVNETDKYNTFNLNLRGGYFIADNLAVGIGLGYGMSKQSSENFYTSPVKNTNIVKNNSMNVGLFARYYKMFGDSKFGVFGQLDLSYNFGKGSNENTIVNSGGTSTSSETTSDLTGFGVNLRPGLVYFVSDVWALEAYMGNIGLTTQNEKFYKTNGNLNYENKSTYTAFSISPSSIFFGVSFYLGGGGD